MVIVSGSPYVRIALCKNGAAAALSRCGVNRKQWFAPLCRCLSDGVAPAARLQNRACGRVGRRRVAFAGTFPTAPLRTARESFDLKQLSSDLFLDPTP